MYVWKVEIKSSALTATNIKCAQANSFHCSQEAMLLILLHPQTHTHIRSYTYRRIDMYVCWYECVCTCCKPIQNDISYKLWYVVNLWQKSRKHVLKQFAFRCICVCGYIYIYECGFCAFSCFLLDFRICEIFFLCQFETIFLFNKHAIPIASCCFQFYVFRCANTVWTKFVNVYKYFRWHTFDFFHHPSNVHTTGSGGVVYFCVFYVI